MLEIYYWLESLYKRYYSRRSEDFKVGYLECFKLFHIAMCKHPQYNAFLRVGELEKEKQELQKTIREKDRSLRKQNKKLEEKSITSPVPSPTFTEYHVSPSSSPFDEFTVIANLDVPSFKNMCLNFALRFKWKDSQEAKAMMLQYINSKSAKGFKAYKDEQSATKEGVRIKR